MSDGARVFSRVGVRVLWVMPVGVDVAYIAAVIMRSRCRDALPVAHNSAHAVAQQPSAHRDHHVEFAFEGTGKKRVAGQAKRKAGKFGP